MPRARRGSELRERRSSRLVVEVETLDEVMRSPMRGRERSVPDLLPHASPPAFSPKQEREGESSDVVSPSRFPSCGMRLRDRRQARREA